MFDGMKGIWVGPDDVQAQPVAPCRTQQALEIAFTVDQNILLWQMPLRIIPLAAAAGLALLLFTWYLHDVSFRAAIVLSLVTLIGAAAGLLAAAAAFAWVGNRLGIDPVIKPVNTWTWPK